MATIYFGTFNFYSLFIRSQMWRNRIRIWKFESKWIPTNSVGYSIHNINLTAFGLTSAPIRFKTDTTFGYENMVHHRLSYISNAFLDLMRLWFVYRMQKAASTVNVSYHLAHGDWWSPQNSRTIRFQCSLCFDSSSIELAHHFCW